MVGLLGTCLEDKYDVLDLLGQGGMGAVYVARHRRIGRRVAIKVMRTELVQNADAVERFVLEARIAGSLGHDNIAEVTDIGVAPDGAPFIVMPLLIGASLAQILARELRLVPARAAAILVQVLGALQAAHERSIVHRDLKPDNVFLTTVAGRSDFVKLLDFGISKILAASALSAEVAKLTNTGTIIGTPAYMSPEQARGMSSIDHRTDIWAAGAMLFEMLSGRLVFEAPNQNLLILQILTQKPRRVRSVAPEVPEALDDIVARALAVEPSDRFASARDMADAIRLVAPAGIAEPLVTGTGPAPPRQIPRDSFVLSETLDRASTSAVASPRAEGPDSRSSAVTPAPSHDPGPGRARARIVIGVGAGVLVALLGAAAAWMGLSSLDSGDPAPDPVVSPLLPAQSAALPAMAGSLSPVVPFTPSQAPVPPHAESAPPIGIAAPAVGDPATESAPAAKRAQAPRGERRAARAPAPRAEDGERTKAAETAARPPAPAPHDPASDRATRFGLVPIDQIGP